MRFPVSLAPLFVPLALPALDIQAPAPPSYLATAFRTEWKGKPMAEALDEVQKAIGRPILASPAAKDALGNRRVVLIDGKTVPIKEALERLEWSQDLRFAAEPSALRVETAEEALARRRRPVDLDLASYGIFTAVRDFPAPMLGLVRGDLAIDPAGGKAEAGPQPASAEGVLEWLSRIAETGSMETRGRTALLVQATPEEEEALRSALADDLALRTRRSSWRVTWGIAKAGAAIPTGLVPTADAARAAQAFDLRRDAVLHALPGQRVHGGGMQERSYVADIDIVNGQQDPSVSVLRTGRMADLRPLPGSTLSLLTYRLDWVDPIGMAESVIAQPTTVDSGGLVVEPKEGAPETRIPPSAAAPGSQVVLQLPTVWSWSPRGEIALPRGQALVLCAEHPLGHAVVAIEEVR